MSTQDDLRESARDKSFVDNLGKVYALYTLGFLGFFILMAILERFGLGARAIGILFLCFTLVIYATIGWLSRTMQVDAYYVAGREVPAVYNGMATAADWMSGAASSRSPAASTSAAIPISPSSSAGPAATCW